MFTNYKKQYDELLEAVVGMGYEVKTLTGIELVKTAATIAGTPKPEKSLLVKEREAKSRLRLLRVRKHARQHRADTQNDKFYCMRCDIMFQGRKIKNAHTNGTHHKPIINATRLVNGKTNINTVSKLTKTPLEDLKRLAVVLKYRV